MGASPGSGHDVVDVQETFVVASFTATAMTVAGQNLATDPRGDGALAAVAATVDHGIAMNGFGFGFG